ncbi:immunity protein TriTu family protein, partial [Gilliamella sp. Occ4-3]|uniref:immunity protein TriTu family protein n=3 Tax=Orbaceae TaxID=1240483 RepID=UPI00080EC235
MLNKFKFWISKNTNYSSDYHQNDLSESIVIDFENDIYIARFTVWDDLSCMSEIVDLNTDQFK